MAERVVGVDGTKTGWLAIVLVDGVFSEACKHKVLVKLLADEQDPVTIAIDMPTALPAGATAAKRGGLPPDRPSRVCLARAGRRRPGCCRGCLAQLMIDFEVRAATAHTYLVKRVDSDYFEEDA